MSQDNTMNPLTGLPMDMDFSPSKRALTTPVSQTAEYKGVDDFANYMKYGVTPTPNSDMDELRAERQSTVEKWRNGIGKFVGKTGTAVLGGTLGSIYGIGSAIANGDLNAFYDNAFQQGMDDINEWLDKKLPNYMTRAEQEEGFLSSLDNANFWANDVLGGLSFTMGAVLTELGLSAATAATGGAGAGIQGAATANMLSRAKTLLKGVDKAKRAQQIKGAARIGRQFITGAGYEAGVEARHFKDEAMKAFQAANPEATNEELAKASKFIKTQANWVFAANMALVGSSNAVQFKKIFGDGIKSQASAGFKQGIRQQEGDLLSGKFVESLAGKYEKLRSNLDIALRTVKNPLVEGIVEEGGQSVISGTAKNYLMKGYSPEGVQAAYDLASAFGDALSETYGSKEGWKEIGIGMIIGGMGSPTFRKAPWAQGGWSGGVMEGYEEYKAGRDEQKDLAIRNTEASYDQVRSLIKSNAAQYESNKEKEQALANGDIFGAKTAEADSMFAFMSARHEAGLLGGTVDEFTKYVQDMSTEEFGQEFGYDVTEEELAARKSDVIRSFKDKASDLSSSWSDAKKLRVGEDYSDEVTNDIQRGIAHSIYSMKDLDRRESSMIEELQGVVKNLNPEYLKSYIKYKNSIRSQKGWIKRRSNILKQAERDFRELVKFSSNYDTPNKDIAKLEKQIEDIKRYRTSLRPSETNKIEALDKKLTRLQDGIINVYKDIVSKNAEKKTLVKQVEEAQRRYESLLKQRDEAAAQEKAELSYNAESLNFRLDGFESLADALKEYEAEIQKVKDAKNPMTARQIDELVHDLAKLATQREYVVKSYNTLLTKPGQEEVAKMTEDMIRMYESATRREEVGRALRSVPKQTKVDADTEADLASTETLEGKKALLQDKIDELKEQAAIEKFDEEMTAKLGAMEARMEELDTEVQEQADAKALLEATPYKPIVNRPHHLGQIIMFNTSPEVKAKLATMSYADILENGEVRFEEYEGTPGEVRDQNWHKGVTTVKGYDNGKLAAHVYTNGDRIGYLPNPRRFVDTKTKQPLDLNKLENLVKINPAFVTNGKLNEDGASFLAKWNSLKSTLENISSTISLKEAFYANPQHSVKILRGSEVRPEIASHMNIPEYQIDTPMGKGMLVVERDAYNPKKVGERVWFKPQGGTWERLEGAARTQQAKYAEELKTTTGKSKLDIQGAGQYALVMNAIYKKDSTPFVYDLSQPTLAETNNESFDAINQQVADLANVDRETGKVLVDEVGRPFFVALSSRSFMGFSHENVRSKITLKKFEDGPKMVLTLQYKGKYYNQTLFTEKTIKDLDLTKMKKRLDQVVKYGFPEIKKDYPDLEFSSFKKSLDYTPSNVEEMTMNAVPHLEIELVGKSYKEQRNKLTGVVPAVKKDYKKEVPKKPTSSFGISELVATKKIYNAAMQINNPTELEALLTEHNDLLEAADSNRDSFKKVGTYIDGITKRYEELSQAQLETLVETPKEKLEKAPKTVEMPFERSTDPADLEGGFELKLPTKNSKEDTDFQNDMKDLLGDDFSFRIANEFEKATSKEEKMELLSSIIPTDLIAVRDLETIYDSLANNGITMGAFIDNVVYLSQYSGDKTAYHEAFHVVYRSLLTKQRFDDINVSAKGRYGKPSKKALRELRETSNAYRFLNQKELENLWYEEKMADDFMEYAYGRKKIEGANWLVRLFNKIIKLIKGIASRKSDVEGLFSDIYEGKFRTAKTLRSNVIYNKPAFMVIKTRDLNGGKISETGFSVLNKQDTNRITYKILNNLINRSARDTGFNPSSGLAIVEEIDNIRSNYYNHKVWIEEAKAYMNQPDLTEDQMQEHKGKLYEKMARIRIINEALDNPENVSNIVKDIQTRLKNYNIFPIDVEHEHDLVEQDYEGNGEDFFGNFDKANYEIGGISSVSQRMKEYIFTTTDSIDEFGFGVDLDNDKYQIPVNGEYIYYGLQRTLVNTDVERLFNKFYNFAKNNSSTRAFYNKFVNDVAIQSGTDVDSVTKSFEAKELSDLELERYRQAPVFNDFISAFVKDQVDFYSVLYDAESTTARMFSSNRVGADQIQFDSWKNNFESLGLTKAQVNQALDTIQELYESPASVAKEADTVTQIQELFGGIGIKLSPTYIQWSLLDYHQDVWRTWNDDRTAEYDNLHSAFVNVDPIHLDLDQLSFNTLRTLNNKSQLETNPSGFFERNVDETTMAVDESTGAQTTLRKIAKSNAKFDETVGDSTFRNAENKQVFDKLNPSFITTIVRRLRESNADLETILASYKLSEYETDVLRQALTYNKFVNGKHEYENGIRSSEEFAQFVFQNLNIIIADGIREESFNDKGSVESWKQSKGGKTYKNLGAEAQELFKLIMYADNTRVKFEGKDVDLRYFLIGNSEKSTQMFVKAPLIKKVVNSMEIIDGKPKFTFSNVVKESLLDLVRQEHARIQKVLSEIYAIQEGTKTDFISSKYHGKFRDRVLYLKQDGKEVPVTVIQDGDTFKLDQMYEGLPRGLKMFRFSNHPLASMIEQSALLNEELDTRAIKDSFDDYYTAEMSQYIDLALLDSGAVSLADGVYTNELLPKEVFGTDSLDFAALANYFMNQVINVANFNQLLHGDLALSYKNLDDVTKRNGGMIAAGPSMGSGKVRYKTVSSVELPMEEVDIARHGIAQDYIDRTDAQNFGTMSFYRKNYLNSLGKHVQAVKPILDKIERGIDLIVPLTKTELDTLDNHNANLHDRKIVGRSATWYDKTSLHTLTRAETSRISKQFYKAHGNNNKSVIAEINRRYEALESAATPEDIRRAAMDVNAIYVAKPGKLERHTILNDMIFKNYDLYIYDSASKMAKFDVDADVVHEIDSEFIREQVNTDGFKNKIVHGTQMIQLIWSEQDQAATVEWEKTKVKYGELVNKYKSLLADRVRKGAVDLTGTIFQFAPDGNLSQDSYRELFGALRNGLITDDLWVTELFELDSNGLPKYDPNYPAIRLKYEAMYLAFVSNRVFKGKVAGRKYTLVSDVGYEIPRENLGEVTKEEAMQDPYGHIQKGDKYYKVGRILGQGEVSGGNAIFSRLRHRIKDTDRFGNEIYVSEVVISEKAARTYGLRPGDEIPKSLQLQMGIRIPTQDMHSMVTMKVVETLPYYYGNSVMLPYEIVLLSGADFDIDSLFARMYEVHSGDVAYGSYYKAKNPISAAHKEYQASGKNVTLEEFKSIEIEGVLLTDQINSNVNAFKTGNLSKIKPLTKSEANNLLLDIEMRLMHNSREIAATPASMVPLKDTLADFQNNGIQSKGRTTGVDSPLDNIKAAKALEIGSKGIGVSAVFNTLFQRLAEIETRIDIPLFTEYNSVAGYQTTIAGQDVRKNDVFSAIISAMTDNAKERLASEFNLTLDTLGAAMYMMSTGMPVDEVLYIMRQPVVSSYTKYMNLESMPISNREVEQVPEIELLDGKNARSLYYTKEALGTTETKSTYEKQDLIDSIIAYEEGGFENLSEEQKGIQAYILGEFTKAKQISEELRAYRAVSSLVKGLDSSWHVVDRMDDSLNKLGINVSKKLGTSGLSPDHWKVSQAMTKTEAGTVRPANFTGMNYVDIMSQFPVDIENIKAAFAQREGSKYYFILQSPVAQRLKSKLKYNFGSSTWDYAENNKQLDDSLISFLITRAFKHKFNPELTLDDLFRIESSGTFEGQNKFHEEIRMLKEKYPDNEFLDKIQLNKSPYTSEYSPYRGKTLHKVEIETNLSSDVTRQEAMIRGFMSIYTKAMENKRLRKESGSPMDNTAVLSIEERVFRNLIGYLIVKDGMLFKNKSFIRAIAPYLVQDAFTSLTSMRNDFAKGQFKDYFGKSELATFRDFEETYSRWNQTNRGLKYVSKKNVAVKGVKGAYTVKEDKGRITVDVYAGTDPTKGSEVNKKITSTNLKGAYGQLGLATMGFNPSGYGKSLHLRLPGFIKKNNQVYRLATRSLKVGKNTLTLDRKGFVLYFPGFDKKRVHLNYLVKAGKIEEKVANSILESNAGYKASYELVTPIGNKDISPFGSTIAEHNIVSTKKETPKPKKATFLKKVKEGKVSKPAGFEGLIDAMNTLQVGSKIKFDMGGQDVTVTINKPVRKPKNLTSNFWWNMQTYEGASPLDASAFIQNMYAAIQKPEGFTYDELMSELKMEVRNPANEIINLKSNC